MDNKEIEFFEKVGKGRNSYVCTLEGSKIRYGVDRPLVISLQPREESSSQEKGPQGIPKLVISAPNPFPFKSTKQVPWNYNAHISTQSEEGAQDVEGSHREAQPTQGEESPKKEVVNEVGHFTRSGRCYSPETTKDSETCRDKDKTVVGEPKKIFREEPPPKINEPMTEAQAQEFLKFLKHSEYNIVEQLHKQQAQISILELLLCSEKHREALLKVLNQTFVPDNISALNITTHCNGYVLPGVLIDNGSALNVLPLATLQRLLVDSSHIKPYRNSVRAFDGTQREAIGKIEIPLLIGPTEYTVEFLVMDIKPTYNCLLGRLWIHSAGAVPSSLHQKLKFVIEGKLVCVEAEQDIIASVTSDTPYVKTNEEAVECTFRALEFVNAAFIAEGRRIPRPRLSNWLRDTFTFGGIVNTEQKVNEAIQENDKLRDEEMFSESLEGMMVNMVSDEAEGIQFLSEIRPCLPGETFNNWTCCDAPVTLRSPIISCMNDAESNPEIGSNADEMEGEIPEELIKLVTNEDKKLLPYQEELETLNLGTEEEIKEVKIGTTLSPKTRQDLIQLLREFQHVFAWITKICKIGYRYCGTQVTHETRLQTSTTKAQKNED
ncbi:hypothetical protein V6N12_010490 [Hibiscus sabdariffa]|uniref:Uncharacterized protein n=1 Tax=Hibiscus sabdariffa TaxID=183260 RepID=A0ABR2EK84_9ROSI